MKQKSSLALALALLLVSSACGAPASTPTQPVISAPTETAAPSFTSTPNPTATTLPSITPTPMGGGSGRIVYENSGDLFVMNTDGSNPTQLTKSENSETEPAWSPDATKIAYTSCTPAFDACTLGVLNADGSNPTTLAQVGPGRAEPAWSPNGSLIAFIENNNGNVDIYVIGMDGSEPVRLTDNDSEDISPAWSPDGTQITFISARDGLRNIYVMSSEGQNQTRLSHNDGANESPTWSPDGMKIAFTSGVGRGNGFFAELYVMNSDGANATKLTETKPQAEDKQAGVSSPVWSPDGQKLAFTTYHSSDTYYNTEIFIMDANGSNPLRLTSSEDMQAGIPEWSPDGSKILFDSYQVDGPKIFLVNDDGSDLTQIGAGSSPAFSR